MTTSMVVNIVLIAVSLAVSCNGHHEDDAILIKSENVTLQAGMRLHLKFPDKTNRFRPPQLLCESLKSPDKSIVSGVVIKRIPALTRIGMMVRFAYKDGHLHSCQMLPEATGVKLDPASCMPSGPTDARPSPNCPSGWLTIEPYCYFVANETGTWAEGKRFCDFKGAQLATVADGFQQTMLANTLQDDTWIGLSVHGKNKTFEWEDKTVFDYVSWAENEPSQSSKYLIFGETENCTEMRKSSVFNWNDAMCDDVKRFLCSVPVEKAFQATKTCPTGWEGFDHSCYYLSTNKSTWNESNAHCKSMDSHLASIVDEGHHAFLGGLLLNSAWIGLHDMTTEGHYEWIDGTKLNFTIWHDGQPTNSKSLMGYGDEDCVEMRRNFQYEWNDEYCSTRNNYICEKDIKLQ